MTTLNQIRIALENHLATMTPAPPPIAWPNVKFAPTLTTTHFVSHFIPVTRRPIAAGPSPEQMYEGLFVVNIRTPQGLGAAAGMGHVDALETRFNGSSAIVTADAVVRIDYGEAKGPLHDTPFYVIPFEIGWRSYATP